MPQSASTTLVKIKLSAPAHEMDSSTDNAVMHPANMPMWLLHFMLDIQLAATLLSVEASPMQDISMEPSILSSPYSLHGMSKA